MSATIEDLNIKVESDSAPPTIDVEYPCIVCGRESGPYGGRGRKPTKCSEHKAPTKGTRNVPRNSNTALAAQAADALFQLNGLVALLGTLAGYEATGEQIQLGNDAFRDKAYEALLTDPELCRTILRGGVLSGRMALVLAYGMFGASVAPVAVMEFKAKRLEKREDV